MAFRADEAERTGYEEAESFLILRPRDATESVRAESREALREIAERLGPVIDTYPTWHPLVRNQSERDTVVIPDNRCGYHGLDHTRYFANGFITCPYGDGQEVLDSVAKMPYHHAATITATRLNVKFYNINATPILVECEWHKSIPPDGMIPASVVVPLILEKEVPCSQWSEVAETWESMRPYFLGKPHGSRSSLFVTQETGQTIKKVWEALIHTGMFGPIKV